LFWAALSDLGIAILVSQKAKYVLVSRLETDQFAYPQDSCEDSMIVCEYLFKEFNTKGSDEYIDSWASHVDHMADDGWEVLECIRRPESFGLWTVLLCRPSRKGPRRKLRPDISEDRVD
jgi:hypothetical protein